MVVKSRYLIDYTHLKQNHLVVCGQREQRSILNRWFGGLRCISEVFILGCHRLGSAVKGVVKPEILKLCGLIETQIGRS